MSRKNSTSNFIRTCHCIQHKGLVSGTGGNISIRNNNDIYITPTSISLESMHKKTIAVLSLRDGKSLNSLKPSKESLMHLMIYRKRDDINAVIHVHSVYSVAISSMPEFIRQESVPVFTPGYSLRIGNIPVLPYQLPGSEKLAVKVSTALESRDSVLLANHGVVTVGKDLESALNLVDEIEENSKVYFITEGKANQLSVEQIKEIDEYYR